MGEQWESWEQLVQTKFSQDNRSPRCVLEWQELKQERKAGTNQKGPFIFKTNWRMEYLSQGQMVPPDNIRQVTRFYLQI